MQARFEASRSRRSRRRTHKRNLPITYLRPPALASAAGSSGVLEFPRGGLRERASCPSMPTALNTSPPKLRDSQKRKQQQLLLVRQSVWRVYSQPQNRVTLRPLCTSHVDLARPASDFDFRRRKTRCGAKPRGGSANLREWKRRREHNGIIWLCGNGRKNENGPKDRNTYFS